MSYDYQNDYEDDFQYKYDNYSSIYPPDTSLQLPNESDGLNLVLKFRFYFIQSYCSQALVECERTNFCVTLVTKDLIKCRSTLINLSLGVLSSALLLWHSCKFASHPHLWTTAAAAQTKPYVSFSAFYR